MKKLVMGLTFIFSLQIHVAMGNSEINYISSLNDENIIDIVQKFKDIIATNNSHYIAKNIIYPFNIGDNCPPIQNEEEFILNYDIIYDSLLFNQIITSDNRAWSFDKKRNVIFYNNPYVQLSLDGHLIDMEYSAKRTLNNEKCISKEKNEIYPSLKKYIKNMHILKTSDCIYRIDLVDKGLSATTYRLAIWNEEQKMSEKPLKIIDNGKLELYGSANNEKYIFADKETSYIIQINTARALETIPIEVTVINNTSSKKYPATNITNNPNLY